MNTLEQVQAQLEQAGLEEGRENFLAAQKKNAERGSLSRNAGAQVAAKQLFMAVHAAVLPAIRKVGAREFDTMGWLRMLDGSDEPTERMLDNCAAKAAHIALQHMFNALHLKTSTAAGAIGRAIRAELEALALAEGHPGLAHYTFKRISESRSGKFKRMRLGRSRKYVEMPSLAEQGFGDDKLLMIGNKLIDIVIASTGAFYTESTYEVPDGKTPMTNYMLRASDSLQKLMNVADARISWMQPVRPPMIVKPLPWEADLRGGYTTDAQRYPFVKRASEALLEEMRNSELTSIRNAVNTLQRTAYRINAKMLTVAQEVWDLDLGIGTMLRRELRVVPAMPCTADDVETFKDTHPDDWHAWKKAASEVHAWNEGAEREAKLKACADTLRIASQFAEYPEIYMPVQLDFRGRAYYVTSGLNPQSNDFGKSLLEFAHAVPMRDEHEDALAFAGASIWANGGLDKKTREERVRWVHDNDGIIRSVARDPLANLWWADADKGAAAWTFLAWCLEWAAWRANGDGYMSHYILFIDGKCNGSQHWSALLRSEADAARVCMMSCEVPSDLYTDVLNVAKLRAREDLYNEEAFGGFDVPVSLLAEHVVDKLTRGEAKRPTMTYSYGVTPLGVRTQLANDCKDFFAQFEKPVRRPVIAYTAGILLDAVEEVVAASAEGMNFVKGVARSIVKTGRPLNWTTPDGFPVQQHYEKFEDKRVRTVMSGGMRARVDMSSKARSTVIKEARKELAKKLKGSELDVIVARLEEVMSYGVFKQLSAAYRQSVQDDTHAAFEVAVGDTFAGALTGRLTPLISMLTRKTLHAMRSIHEHLETDGTLNMTLKVATGVLDKNKQVTAAAPSFIHSLDATHLRMTVNACADAGVTDFAGIHDSFGVHVGNIDVLHTTLREQFIKLYSEHDPLADLIAVAKQQLDEEEAQSLPDIPAKGTLDLACVREAAFFFA